MNLLFLGGTGNISSSVTQLCLSRGDEVWIVTRGKNVLPQSGRIHSIVCDVNDPDALLQVLHGKTFDAAIDFICFTSQQAKEHTEALRGKSRSLYFHQFLYRLSEAMFESADYGGYPAEKSVQLLCPRKNRLRALFPAGIPGA